MLLSGGLITKNAEHFLKESISSYIDFVDELIVVDDGSTDGTLDICASFGSKVKIIRGDFGRDKRKQRQTYVNNARGRWIFCPDSDEVYFAQNLLDVVDYLGREPHIYTIVIRLLNFWKDFDHIIHGHVWDAHMQRFFLNDGTIGYHDLHHSVSLKPGVNLYKATKSLRGPTFRVPHYSYLKSPKHIYDKVQYYMRRDNPNCKINGEINEDKVKEYTLKHPFFSNDFSNPRYGIGGLYCCGSFKSTNDRVDLYTGEHPPQIKNSELWKKMKGN